jgi:hypothetical protein
VDRGKRAHARSRDVVYEIPGASRRKALQPLRHLAQNLVTPLIGPAAQSLVECFFSGSFLGLALLWLMEARLCSPAMDSEKTASDQSVPD